VLNMSSPRPCPPPRNPQQRSYFLLLKLSGGGGLRARALQQEAASGVMLSQLSLRLLLPQSNQKGLRRSTYCSKISPAMGKTQRFQHAALPSAF
jgi:hypothetical protein